MGKYIRNIEDIGEVSKKTCIQYPCRLCGHLHLTTSAVWQNVYIFGQGRGGGLSQNVNSFFAPYFV